MKIEINMSDDAILKELGSRIARIRLNKNITQKALAKEAGVSLPTIQRIENGHASNTANLIRTMRALQLLTNLELAIPEPPISPIMQLEMQNKARSRASKKKAPKNTHKPYKWGDE